MNERDVDKNGQMEKLIKLRRVTKVTKGGKTMRFSAIVVVGNQQGSCGIGTGKANEVVVAIKKARTDASRNMVKFPTKGTTIAFEINYKNRLIMKPAPAGTGIRAGSWVRAIIECAGIENITCKNTLNATSAILVMDYIRSLPSLESMAEKTGRRVEDIIAV